MMQRLMARFRYRAIVSEIAAIERQMQQAEAYRKYLLEQERQAAIVLLIAEGGDVAPALRECAVHALEERAPARKVASNGRKR